MTFEDLDAWRKARRLVKGVYAFGNSGSLVSGLIASTRRRLAGKIAAATTLILLCGWCTLRLLS